MYQLTPQEEAFYKQMWSQLDPNGNGFAEGKDTVQFFKKSRLPVQQLKAVWVTAVRNEEGKLFYHEFTTAMRLIAYCQNGFEMSEALLHETRLVPLPVMDGFPVQAPSVQTFPVQAPSAQPILYQTQPVQNSQQISLQQFVEPKNNMYDLPPDLYGKYETCFRQQDKGNQGFIPSDPAKAFFQKSGLPLPTLMNLWELVDEGRKGYLSKNEFIVAVHLIALSRKDIPLPQFLPDSLIQIMKRDQQDQVRPTSQTVQPITSQIPPQRVSSQNELQGLGQVGTLQNRVQNQSQQIQLANNLDAQKQIIEDKKKDIEFLNQTIQKLQQFYNYLKNEQDELAAQLTSLNGQCAQKQQQMSALQDCIQNQLQVNQGLQKQIFELKSGQENQPQSGFQTIHLDDDYDYSGYRAKKEKLGSGGNNEILPWH